MKKLLGVVIILNILIKASVNFEYTQSCKSSKTKRSQHFWIKDYPQCGGYWQSPIVITASRSIALPLPALEMIGYHDLLLPPLVLKNNGHTVTLQIKNESSKKRAPYIFGALLNEREDYEMESLHFHWGLSNSRGSEHMLHGARYPMEMHLIHRNMKYQNLEIALQHEDGLSVLGIFFHLQEDDNYNLKPIIDHLVEVQWANTETLLNRSLVLARLLPEQLDTYYTYRGSLTTPPCNEVVTWIVFASTVPISFKQMSKFRILSNGKSILADNYRSLQNLNNRKVYVRRMHSIFLSKNEVANLDVSSIKWYWQ